MTIKRILCLLCILACGLLMTGCFMATETETDTEETEATLEERTVEKVEVEDINDLLLTDDESVYEDQDPTSLAYFYITVQGGNAADDTDHTFAEVNSYTNVQGTNNEKIRTGILFQVGDEYGPLTNAIGYGVTTNNATMNVRGRTSTLASQKSYRIDLFSTAGLWNDQRAIAINKHPYDSTRLRNMLYFTLLQQVPSMTSLRTQFVQVYIKDETAGETAFTDYGLFTQVELPNGRYLRNHSLSRNGNLYKANFCEFYRYEDQIMLATDPDYDLEAFSDVLEPKTSEDHTKLIAMLDAVNDESIPIQDVIETYFSLDNLTSFLAYNILMGNVDTSSQNYLIYSPVNSDVWYFICWDGDGSLTYYEDEILYGESTEGSWRTGVSNYWGMVLFNRMLRVEAFREALVEKVELLRTIITPEVIAAEIAEYRTVVDQFTQRMPDLINLNCTLEQLELIYENMPYDVDYYYEQFIESLQKPMPFYLGLVTLAEDETGETLLSFTWSEAYSFEAETVHYTLQIATDWSFEADTIVYESEPQLYLSLTAPMLEAGEYCWRVIAENESGYTQTAFDGYVTGTTTHYGMTTMVITEDGEVQNP